MADSLTSLRHACRAVSPTPLLAAALAAILLAPAPGQDYKGIIDASVVVGGLTTDFRALADLDGDGRQEAISVAFPTAQLCTVQGWRFANAAPALGWQTSFANPSASTYSRIATGDFNGDGREDFALSVQNVVGWWISTGPSTPPSIPWAIVLSDVASNLVAADFNGDGRADLAVQTPSDLTIYLSQAAGPPVLASSITVPFVTTPTALLALDVTGDGAPDLVLVAAIGSVQVRFYAVTQGVIGSPQVFGPVIGTNLSPTAAAGDIDGDGDQDILVFADNQRAILRRTGPATFNPEPPVPAGRASLLADLNGDGLLDDVGYAVAPSIAPASATTTTPANFYVQLNLGGGALSVPFTIASVGGNTLAGAADLDGDGDLELVGGRCVRWTEGPFPQPPHAITVPLPAGAQVVDFDQDGDPDLSFELGAAVRNEGDSRFGVAPPVPSNLGLPAGVTLAGPGVAGDFDGDGAPDLVVARSGGSGGVLPARLLRNTGGGGLRDGGDATAPGLTPFESSTSPYTAFQVPLNATGAVVGDADGDGDLDLVTHVVPSSALPGGQSRVWINDGSGFFSPLPPLAGEYALAVADFDGDSIPDLLSAQAGSVTTVATLRILHGLGGGTFGAATTITTDFNPRYQVGIADFDGDGRLDLVVSGVTTLAVQLNRGGGVFTTVLLGSTQSTAPLPVGFTEPLHRAFATDLDGDGLIDVVGGPLADTGGAFAFIRATAPGVFGPPIIQPLDVRFVADFDGDGDPDVATDSVIGLNRHFAHGAGGIRVQHGTALAGSGSFAPVLGDRGPFRVGSSGEIRITNGLGGATGWLGLGTAETSIPIAGGLVQVFPDILLPIQLGGSAGSPGRGSLAIPWTLPPSVEGWTIHHQVALADPGAPQGVSFTRVLTVTIGS